VLPAVSILMPTFDRLEFLPPAIESVSLRRHPTRRCSCTGFSLIDAAGQPLAAPRGSSCPTPSGWVRERLLTDAVIAMPSVIVARDLLEQAGPLDEELVMCYDDELWLRLAAASGVR
jgi:hypothetical protein